MSLIQNVALGITCLALLTSAFFAGRATAFHEVRKMLGNRRDNHD